MIRLVIPIDPVTKKNSQRIVSIGGRPRLLPSKQFAAYQDACGQYLVDAAGMDEFPIDYPVNIRCLFYRRTKRRCDLTNLLEAIDDVLVHYGLLADDNCHVVAAHDGSRVMYDKENPRTEIEIERLIDDAESDDMSVVQILHKPVNHL